MQVSGVTANRANGREQVAGLMGQTTCSTQPDPLSPSVRLERSREADNKGAGCADGARHERSAVRQSQAETPAPRDHVHAHPHPHASNPDCPILTGLVAVVEAVVDTGIAVVDGVCSTVCNVLTSPVRQGEAQRLRDMQNQAMQRDQQQWAETARDLVKDSEKSTDRYIDQQRRLAEEARIKARLEGRTPTGF